MKEQKKERKVKKRKRRTTNKQTNKNQNNKNTHGASVGVAEVNSAALEDAQHAAVVHVDAGQDVCVNVRGELERKPEKNGRNEEYVCFHLKRKSYRWQRGR